MDSEYVKNMVSDILKISVGKIKVSSHPNGDWTATDIIVNSKPLTTEQAQIVGDILFWQQWWFKGHTTKCPKCEHKLDVHSKCNSTHAGCRYCSCICEIDTGVYIPEGDSTVVQALSRVRRI